MRRWKSAAATRLKRLAGAQSVEASVVTVVGKLLEGVRYPPTDLDAVMRKLGVNGYETDPTLIVPGELRKQNNQYVIFLIPGLSKGRKRFTIAHELGHAVFEKTGPRCPRKGDELEKLCDKIAAEILMPTHVFRDLAGKQPAIDRLLELTEEFDASLSATFFRASELYGVCSFGVDDGAISWSAGISKQRVAQAGFSLEKSIQLAMKGEPGKEPIEFFSGGNYTRWNMEWRCLGQQRRAVFLLTH
jgi:hypothetical protein